MGSSHGEDMAFADVASLLAPRSVVVVGASDRENNLGGAAVRYLQKFSYPGDVWVVNPNRDRVGGLPTHPSVADIPEVARPSLAILAVPAAATIGLVEECSAAGIHYGVIWSGGFAEQRTEEGVALQAQLVAACERFDFTVVGPNCLGVIDTHQPMTASFSSLLLKFDTLEPGSISMVSQSGGLASMIQALSAEAGYYFRYMISSGNEAVTTTGDYLHALVEDPETKVIALYLEGVGDGEKFVAALDEARQAGKPVVVLKTGRSAATARAAQAHTGAMVGEDRVWRSVFQEYGAIQVDTLDELLDVVLFLSSTDLDKLPDGGSVAVVTFGGGMGVLAADDCTRNGLTTAEFTVETQRRLRGLVPPIAGISNPVDLTPAAYSEPYISQLLEAFEVMADDPGIDMILAQFGTTWLDGYVIADAVLQLRERTDKTVAIAWPFAPEGIRDYLQQHGMYAFTEYARATGVLGRLVHCGRLDSRPDRGEVDASSFDWEAHLPAVEAGTVVAEHRTTAMLAAAGLPTAEGYLVSPIDDVIETAHKVEFPVVMKGISAAVTHRASAGLLALDLRTDEEVRDASRRLEARAAELGIDLDGFYVQHLVARGAEIFVSAFRDPVFGTIVSVGAGGTLTEVIDDVVLARAPFDAVYATDLVQCVGSLQRAKAFDRTDAQAVGRFVADFSRLAAGVPWERFILEINPIKCDGADVVLVDSLLIVAEP